MDAGSFNRKKREIVIKIIIGMIKYVIFFLLKIENNKTGNVVK
jgi:hypothetical protein